MNIHEFAEIKLSLEEFCRFLLKESPILVVEKKLLEEKVKEYTAIKLEQELFGKAKNHESR